MNFIEIMDCSVPLQEKLPKEIIDLIDDFTKDITCSQCSQSTKIMYQIRDSMPDTFYCYDCIDQYFIDTLFEEDYGLISSIYLFPTTNLNLGEDMEELGNILLVHL